MMSEKRYEGFHHEEMTPTFSCICSNRTDDMDNVTSEGEVWVFSRCRRSDVRVEHSVVRGSGLQREAQHSMQGKGRGISIIYLFDTMLSYVLPFLLATIHVYLF